MFKSSVSAMIMLLLVASNAWGGPLTLPGPNAITLPYVFVPFVSSERVIIQGTKTPDGTCKFPVDISVSPGQLLPGQRFVRIQRQVDLVTCQELLEQGPVWKTTEEGGASDTMRPAMATSASATSYSYSGSATVRWTDEKNPAIQALKRVIVTDGLDVSKVSTSATWSTTPNASGCLPSSFTVGTPAATTWYQWLTGWKEISPAVITSSFTSCVGGIVSVSSLVHENSTSIQAIFDCTNGGIRIHYDPFTFKINALGSHLTGMLYSEGDSVDCGEYMVRRDEVE